MSTQSVFQPLTINWRDGQEHRAVSGGVSVTVYPSSEHPGFWFARKISLEGMEEFRRPARLCMVEHYIFRSHPVLPPDAKWEVGPCPPITTPSKPHDLRRNCVYFIEAAGLNAVKIGYTFSGVRQRLANLQIGCPVELRLLARQKGDAQLETWLHERFADLHLRGEWFRLEGELLNYIETLKGEA